MSEKTVWWIVFAVILATMIFSTPSHAAAQLVPQQGLFCWVPPTTNANGSTRDPATLSYQLGITKVGGTETLVDLGTSANATVTSPITGKACPTGSIGIARNSTTPTSGNYTFRIAAYDTALGIVNGIGGFSPQYAFSVDTTCTKDPCPGSLPAPAGGLSVR